MAQEIDRRPHYSDQFGHASRGIANRFREVLGYKPIVFGLEPFSKSETGYIRRRSMRRVTRDGK